MTQITIPDDIPAWDLERALYAIGLMQASTFPPAFVRRPRQQHQHGQCAEPGCNRDGAIRWGDDDVSWCSDHAWDQRGAA